MWPLIIAYSNVSNVHCFDSYAQPVGGMNGALNNIHKKTRIASFMTRLVCSGEQKKSCVALEPTNSNNFVRIKMRHTTRIVYLSGPKDWNKLPLPYDIKKPEIEQEMKIRGKMCHVVWKSHQMDFQRDKLTSVTTLPFNIRPLTQKLCWTA